MPRIQIHPLPMISCEYCCRGDQFPSPLSLTCDRVICMHDECPLCPNTHTYNMTVEGDLIDAFVTNK